MRIKDIITEFERTEASPYSSKQMSLAQIVAEIQTRCTDFIPLIQNLSSETPGGNRQNFLYRGLSDKKYDFFVAWPATGARGSTNVPNHYRQLIDTSAYFKGWPKRNNSFLCATNYAKAFEYRGQSFDRGSVYCVIPINGTKIAVCPHEDMWRTRADFGELYSGSKESSGKINFQKISRFFEENFNPAITPEQATQRVVTPAIEKYCQQVGVDPNNFWAIIDRGMSPEVSGFQLVTTKSFSSVQSTNHECWISDPVILFKVEKLEDIKKALGEKTDSVTRNPGHDQENFAANIIVELCIKESPPDWEDLKTAGLSRHATNIVNYINTPIRSGNVNIDQASIQIMGLLNKLNFESAIPSIQRIKKYMETNQIADKRSLANNLITKWRTKQKPKQAVHPPEYVNPTQNTSTTQSLAGSEKFPVTGLAGAALGARRSTNRPA